MQSSASAANFDAGGVEKSSKKEETLEISKVNSDAHAAS